MSLKNHIILAAITIIAWAAFYLLGLPMGYYTQWSTAEKILLLWIALFGIFPLATFIINSLLIGDDFVKSIWLSIYASLGLFLLDFIFVGILQHQGIHFLITHWHISIAYVEAIIIIPLVGYSMKKFKEQ
jgi:hypothetical protein